MAAGTGGFAQTPAVTSREETRFLTTIPRSPTRKEAVFACPTGPSAHKSGPSVIYRRREQKPDPPRCSDGQAVLSLQEEAGLERPRARNPPLLRAGSEGAGPDHRPTPRALWPTCGTKREGERNAGRLGLVRGATYELAASRAERGVPASPIPPASSGTTPRAGPVLRALFRTWKRSASFERPGPLGWDAVTQGRGAGARGRAGERAAPRLQTCGLEGRGAPGMEAGEGFKAGSHSTHRPRSSAQEGETRRRGSILITD